MESDGYLILHFLHAEVETEQKNWAHWDILWLQSYVAELSI